MSGPTRWAQAGDRVAGYAETFERLLDEGADVAGEARLADALLPRGGRVLDVGSGVGRVAAALAERGHQVVGVEPDAALVARSRTRWPWLPVVAADILDVDAEALREVGAPTAFDLAVCVGNVLAYTADGTEQAVLARIAGLLAPGGRVLVGHHLVDRPHGARHYPVDRLAADARPAGLRLRHHFGTYELHAPDHDYAVVVLERD